MAKRVRRYGACNARTIGQDLQHVEYGDAREVLAAAMTQKYVVLLTRFGFNALYQKAIS